MSGYGDEKVVIKQERLADRLANRRRKQLRAQLNTPEGRAWMFWLLSETHVFRTSFDGQSLRLAFNEGERNIGLKLWADIQDVAPDLFTVMCQEAKKQEEENNA